MTTTKPHSDAGKVVTSANLAREKTLRPDDPYPDNPALKMTLHDMGDFLLDLRGTGYMETLGKDGHVQRAGDEFRLITVEDRAKLCRVIAALNYFALQREREKR